jgi:Response regulator containing CheY-like receiver, AAA-type ATPase, and DNA-binding domains
MTDAAKTILIVDDEADLAESYALRLDEHYETTVATSGGEALTKLGPDIDLVLLDRRMPGMAGDDVIKRIDDWELEFQVVLVSAIDPDMDIIDLPFDGYLTKSVSKDELLNAVEQAFLKQRYEELVAEYNAAAETYDVLQRPTPKRSSMTPRSSPSLKPAWTSSKPSSTKRSSNLTTAA